MPIGPGARLGPYEILAPLGAGGMGEVYRAKDTRLDRTVAIKVLPAHAADSPEQRQRLDREARAIAGLTHPHICTLYDVGHQDGIDYLVMEHLDGETLAARLTKGALPLEQVLKVAIEIAEALDKAHRAGIVHRDLKPGNVMLTKSGAKLLDFGLAKATGIPGLKPWSTPGGLASGGGVDMEPDPAVTSVPTSPAAALTAKGTILGTLQYMAPEQLEGSEVDARTDIFSFGAVLYEMLTGRRAFDGKSAASVIAAVLESHPPIAASPPATPALERVVMTCLAKNPDDRWQTMRDLRRELEWIATGVTEQTERPALPPKRPIARRAVAALAWLLAGGLLAWIVLVRVVPATAPTAAVVAPISFEVQAPVGTAFGTQPIEPQVAISPDGRYLAFVVEPRPDAPALWVRDLGTSAARPLQGTDDAIGPFWSPDSRFLGFFTWDGKLKKIDISGGPPLTLCDATNAFAGATWNDNDVILFRLADGLYRVGAAGGGLATAVTRLDSSKSETAHRFPVFLPDGRHFLYLVRSGDPDHQGIYVGSLDSNERKRILPDDSNMAFAPPDSLLFVRESTLLVQPFDAARLELTGPPRPLAHGVDLPLTVRRAPFDVSRDVLVYRAGGLMPAARLAWVDRKGSELGTLGRIGGYSEPSISPDGRQAAVTFRQRDSGSTDIWLFDIGRGFGSRFTTDPAAEIDSAWAPNGSAIAFASSRDGQGWKLYTKALTGGAPEQRVLSTAGSEATPDWSPDGRLLMYSGPGPGGVGVWVVPASSPGAATPILTAPSSVDNARFSPDGRWIAYLSYESGTSEVYVESFPAQARKWRVSRDGGVLVRWSRNGRELFYMARDGTLMAVPIKTKTAEAFEVGEPVALFRLAMPMGKFDVTADGQRFLIVQPVEEAQSSVTVVVNWNAQAPN